MRLVREPFWMINPGLAVEPSATLRILLSVPKVNFAEPVAVNCSGVALVPVVAAT